MISVNAQNWLPSVLNNLLDNEWMPRANTTAPSINVFESESGYTLDVAAPGMTKEDFKVNIDAEDHLVISMEKKNRNTDQEHKGRFLRREFADTKFEKCMILPDDVNKEKISAKVENGILSIEIPKLTETEIKQNQRFINIE